MGIIISLPVSLLLLWLVLKPKKNDPFPKGGLARLFLAGALSTILSSVVYLLLVGLILAIRIGPERITQLVDMFRTDPAGVPALLESISPSRERSPLYVLFTTLITAGLLEELSKYIAARAAIRRKDMVRTWMDAVICFTVVGLTFEVLENILYAQQNGILTAVIRNLVPVHFCCGVIMGWYYGKSLVTGKKKYCWAALLVPVAIHTFYDTALNLMASADSPEMTDSGVIFGMLGLLAFAAAIAMTVITIVKLVKWRKKGTLDVPVADNLLR